MSEATNTAKAAYELRTLCAEDVFPMFKIISKIGIKEFKHCFESVDVKEAISGAANGKQVDLNSVGVAVAIDIAGVVIANVPNAKEDIYLFLSQISNLTKDEIKTLPLATFAEMILDVVKKEEFKDFFQVVSKLFK